MNLIQESYERLFPEREFTYQTKLGYNRRLGDFNANIRKFRDTIEINLNLQWKDIDNEIKIGLIQHLLMKVFKDKKNTPNILLYNNFVKNIDILTPKTKSHPVLEQSFLRVNEQFFYNQMDQPNLQWGTASYRKLASYNYHNDTVTVSTLFNEARPEVLDYLMYHELLHKHFKFNHNNGRSTYHSKEFKRAEKKYPNYKEIEKELSRTIRSKKIPKKRKWWLSF